MTEDLIVVAGAGLGGLGVALGLAQNGKRAVVLEKAPALGEIGAGIQLGPNAFHSFDYLGVGKRARKQAVYVERLRFMDAMSAEEVNNVPLGEGFRERFGNPYAVVHRADLHKELVNACEEHDLVELRVNSEVIGYDQDGTTVTAHLASGERVNGSLLIGADGLHSSVRGKVIGDGAPRTSGHSTYRAVIPVDTMPEDLRWNAATLWMGPKCHLVHYPLSGWKVFNLVVTKDNHAQEVVAGKPLTKADVHEHFDHIHETPRRLIDLSEDWRVWVLCDREPVDNWVDGRVVLLGDAAHPTLQYYAQGACMALEDGVCLSQLVAANPDNLDGALQRYQERRLVRTARIQIGSRQLGDNWFHVDGVHRLLRNEIMGNMTAEDYYNQLDWLYGHNEAKLAA